MPSGELPRTPRGQWTKRQQKPQTLARGTERPRLPVLSPRAAPGWKAPRSLTRRLPFFRGNHFKVRSPRGNRQESRADSALFFLDNMFDFWGGRAIRGKAATIQWVGRDHSRQLAPVPRASPDRPRTARTAPSPSPSPARRTEEALLLPDVTPPATQRQSGPRRPQWPPCPRRRRRRSGGGQCPTSHPRASRSSVRGHPGGSPRSFFAASGTTWPTTELMRRPDNEAGDTANSGYERSSAMR